MNIKITGYVEVTLKDKDGNIIAQESGYNDVTEMSNNILMDAILPLLGSSGSPTSYTARSVQTSFSEPNGMTADAVTPYGSYYVGPAGNANPTDTQLAVNRIGYIAVGTGNTATTATFSNMADTTFHSPGYSAFTATGDTVSDSLNVRMIDSVTFGGSGDSVTFTTTFGIGEGNLASDIAEIGIWTTGNNVDVDGYANVQTPTTKDGMRLFARRVLGNPITKTDDGTLDISYTLTFGA
jgi:hypothetical protein